MNPTGSTYFALENEALKAEISRLRNLCTCAADALEFWSKDWEGRSRVPTPLALIAQLRKAATVRDA